MFSVAWDLQLVDLFIIRRIVLYPVWMVLHMDEGTLKTPIPKCSFYWSFCFGWGSNFVSSESGEKQCVKLLQNMAYNTTQHAPPPTLPQPHTVCIYCTFSLGGGGVEVREKVEGQQYTSIVPFVRGGNSSQAASKIPTMSEFISSL